MLNMGLKSLMLFNTFSLVLSFFGNYQSTLSHKKYNNFDIDVYHNKMNDIEDVPCILFFTGLNSIVPAYVYDDFLKTVSDNNVTCYVASNNIETNEELLDDIIDTHRNVTIVGHSSGCITAAKSIDKNTNVKSIVFLDPVDNSFLFDKYKKPNLNNVDDILIINAEKSYTWEWDNNIKVPFIPAFKMTSKSIKIKSPNIVVLAANDYGHTDLLSKPWTDFMHNTISRGTTDRSNKNLKHYRQWLACSISNFINKNYTLHSITNSLKSTNVEKW